MDPVGGVCVCVHMFVCICVCLHNHNKEETTNLEGGMGGVEGRRESSKRDEDVAFMYEVLKIKL